MTSKVSSKNNKKRPKGKIVFRRKKKKNGTKKQKTASPVVEPGLSVRASNSLNKCKIKQYVDLMQKKYISYWNHTLQHSQKLNFYFKIKTNYSPSAYLDLTRKNPSRKTLVKLRISSHKLRIETGKYDNIPRDERLCNLCNCNRIEDETHFLLDCPSFSSIRDMFFSKLEPKIPFVRLQSHESLLSHLMNSTDYFINIQLISFISTCFELRDKLIPGIIIPSDG